MTNPLLDAIQSPMDRSMPEWPFRERPDFTHLFNTPLTEDERAAFDRWAAAEAPHREGRDPRHDLFDYDMQGFWKSAQTMDLRGHATDEFKKPNHPTFSDQSRYARHPGMQPGRWVEDPSGKTTFHAGPSNLRYMTPDQLRHYFRDVEPDVELKLPHE